MKDCIFCRIASHDAPADIVYEDERVIAFLEINPYAEGHIMAIPKRHSRWLWDMSSSDYAYLMEKVKGLAKALQKAFRTEWVESVVAGRGVAHTHVHLLPRQTGDGLGEIPTKPLFPRPAPEEKTAVAEKIRRNL